jgi:hypothetical protein
LPPFLRSRPIPVQVVLVAGVPAAFGALCGWILGVNETAYLVLSLLALIGAYVAGREHPNGREAALRGAIAGAFFGGGILLVHEATGKEPKADLPEPEILLLAVTVVVSALAGAFGGMDRKRLEESESPPQGFSLKRLHWSELLGFLGSAVLLGSLWLPWFSTSGNPHSKIGTAAIGPNQSADAWQTFRILDILLAAACLAPFILAYIVARNAELSWKPGEVTMIVGITCVVLILCNGIILGKPKPNIEISLSFGYLVALLGAAALFASGFLRQALHQDQSKPPGVL